MAVTAAAPGFRYETIFNRVKRIQILSNVSMHSFCSLMGNSEGSFFLFPEIPIEVFYSLIYTM